MFVYIPQRNEIEWECLFWNFIGKKSIIRKKHSSKQGTHTQKNKTCFEALITQEEKHKNHRRNSTLPLKHLRNMTRLQYSTNEKSSPCLHTNKHNQTNKHCQTLSETNNNTVTHKCTTKNKETHTHTQMHNQKTNKNTYKHTQT